MRYRPCNWLGLVLILMFGIACPAANWTAGGSNAYWTTPANWNTNSVPTSTDPAIIKTPNYTSPNANSTASCSYLTVGHDKDLGSCHLIISGGTLTSAGVIKIGNLAGSAGVVDMSAGIVNAYNMHVGYSGAGIFNINGGEVDINSYVSIGNNPTATGTLNVTGGNLNVDYMYIGNWGNGTLHQTGGTITVSGDVGSVAIPNWTTARGRLQLDGGTFICQELDLCTNGGRGTIDMSGSALLEVYSNRVGLINKYIHNGWMTSHKNAGQFNIAYDANTNYTKVTVSCQRAWNPSPADTTCYVSTTPTLTWSSGNSAVSHDVYFGTSLSDVQNATTASPQYKGRRSGASYSPGTLTLGQTYYWRIDEVNGSQVYKGLIWYFKVSGTSIAYNPDPADGETQVDKNRMLTWTPASSSVTAHRVYLGTDYQQVLNATTASSGVYQGQVTIPAYNFTCFDSNQVYYWRIDEVAGSTTKGNVWTFQARYLGNGGSNPDFYVVDIYDDPSWNTNLTDTLMAFQGIINRKGPRLFVVTRSYQRYWLDVIEKMYGLSYTTLQDVNDIFAIPAFIADCSKVVVYDQASSKLSVNAAMIKAGIKGCTFVEKSDWPEMQGYGFTIDSNYSNTFTGMTAEQVQKWTFDNLRNDCNGQNYFGLSRGDFYGRNMGPDFYTQQKLFIWMLDSAGTYIHDQTEQNTILASFAPNVAAFGSFTTEVVDVQCMSNYGHPIIVDGGNVSFFDMLPKPGSSQMVQPRIATRALPSFQSQKTYIMLSFTQGDAASFCQSFNVDYVTFPSSDDPNKNIRERVPFGMMQFTPSYDFEPMLPAWLYKNQNPNQLFFNQPYGYANATNLYLNGYLNGWLAKGRTYMDKMGHFDIEVIDPLQESDFSHTVIKQICSTLKPRAIFLKNALDTLEAEADPPAVFSGVPVFADPVLGRLDNAGNILVDDTISAIVSSAAKRKWLWVYLQHNVEVDTLEQLYDKLVSQHGNTIAVVSPDVFVRLYLCHQIGLTGDFNQDCVVDFNDLSALSQAWLSTNPSAGWNPACDLAAPYNSINFNDLAVFSAHWLSEIN